MSELCYLDSSVAVHVVVGTPTAVRWFDETVGCSAQLVSSRLLEVETARFLRRERLDPGVAAFLVASVALLSVDDVLLREAAALRPVLKTLDCLHLASALRIGAGLVTVATHDAAMARAAAELGFDTVDPVT